jgi:small subunit ribosomal protein S6
MSTILSGFETTFITRNEMGDEALKGLIEKLKGAISGFNGEVVFSEDLGNKKLAYKIQNEQRGRYTYLVYTGKGNVVQEVERNLRLNDQVLRFLSVNIAKEFSMDKFKADRDALKAAAKKRDEERAARKEEAKKAAEKRSRDDDSYED